MRIHATLAGSVLYALLSLVSVRTGPAQEIHNPVLAVVNETIITQRDIEKAAAPHLKKIDPSLPHEKRMARSAVILRQALRTLIENKLIDAKAKSILKQHDTLERQLKDDIAKHMEEERRKAGGDVRLREQIRKAGLTYAEHVENIRSRLLQDMVIGHFVLRNVTVRPDEIADYYEANRGTFTRPAQVKFRRVYVRNRDRGGRDKAEAVARKLMTRLREGKEDFAEVARADSNGPRAAEGGLWDFERAGLRPKPVNELLLTAPVGEVGGPAETKEGFTIVQVLDRKPEQPMTFDEAQEPIRAYLVAEKRKTRYLDFIRKLERENYVEVRQAE